MKTIIVLICTVILFSLTIPTNSQIHKQGNNKVNLYVLRDNFTNTVIRVYENGSWWIYVYDEDGTLVVIYPDEE